jgi:7-cyano-7-deazaguanine synthase
MPETPNAVVLLSGGVDSTTTLALARHQGFAVHALTFSYGQRHTAEIEAARRVAAAFGVARHVTVAFDLRTFGGSALTADIAVPKDRAPAEMTTEIPVTYVPARNTIFLSFALAWAETLGSTNIFIGVTAVDYAGYPDCRPEYVEAFRRMADLATKAGAEIIRAGLALGVDYSLTLSCYDPAPAGACGRCDSCVLRLTGLARGTRSATVRRSSRSRAVPRSGRAAARRPARRRARGSSRRSGTARPSPEDT